MYIEALSMVQYEGLNDNLATLASMKRIFPFDPLENSM